MTQTPKQIAEQLVADWSDKISPIAWDWRGFAEVAARRAMVTAADTCEQIAMKHQQAEGSYAAGKKAGAFECAETLRGN